MPRQKFMLSGLGVINVPVKMTKIADSKDSNMKERHTVCGGRLGRKTWCNTCNVEVPSEEKGKGYETNAKAPLIPLSTEEIARLIPTFVPQATIEIINIIEPVDFRWFRGSHYVINPDGKNPSFALSLSLLYTALSKMGKVAQVRWFDSRKVYNAVLNSNGIVSTIYFSDEVDTEAKYVADEIKDTKLLQMITELCKRNAKPFNPSTDLVDNYATEIAQLIMEKQEKGDFHTPEPKAEPKVQATMDFEAQLKKALLESGGEISLTGTEG